MLQSLVCKKNVKSIKPLDILAEMFIECLQRIPHVTDQIKPDVTLLLVV
jgi:hypothetical protein